jgi:hypothetical protein
VFLNRGSTDPCGLQVVSNVPASWLDSIILFICLCIAANVKLFSSRFLLPRWSKKTWWGKVLVPSICNLVGLYYVYSKCIRSFWRRSAVPKRLRAAEGAPRYQRGWEALQLTTCGDHPQGCLRFFACTLYCYSAVWYMLKCNRWWIYSIWTIFCVYKTQSMSYFKSCKKLCQGRMRQLRMNSVILVLL